MIIIGLTGKAGAGKSTFAEMLIENYLELTRRKKNCWILPFAKALKDMAIEMGWNGEKDNKGRRLLQLLGTDVCRECIDPNYWINKWDATRKKAVAKNIDLLIVDDVRFANESIHILSLNGSNYQITGRAYAMDEDASKHKSENVLTMPSDSQISNDSTLAALNIKALTLIKNWKY